MMKQYEGNNYTVWSYNWTNQVRPDENVRLQKYCSNLDDGHTWMTLNFQIILISNNLHNTQKLPLDSETCQRFQINLPVNFFVQRCYACQHLNTSIPHHTVVKCIDIVLLLNTIFLWYIFRNVYQNQFNKSGKRYLTRTYIYKSIKT
jgi:hypothetical protein